MINLLRYVLNNTMCVTYSCQFHRDVNDIDLFVGGLSENHMFVGSMGRTFACIFAKQFHNLKIGDRFFL